MLEMSLENPFDSKEEQTCNLRNETPEYSFQRDLMLHLQYFVAT